jgi:hypothetical protein
MTTFEFKRLVYVVLMGHHGPMKSCHEDITRYSQQETAARAVPIDYVVSNGVGTDQPGRAVPLKAARAASRRGSTVPKLVSTNRQVAPI